MVGWVTLATDFLAAMTREDDGQLIETFQGVGLMRQKLAILASAVGRMCDPIVMLRSCGCGRETNKTPLFPLPQHCPQQARMKFGNFAYRITT